MRSCLAQNCKGVWAAAKCRWWLMTRVWIWAHTLREAQLELVHTKPEKKPYRKCTTVWHHWTKQNTTKHRKRKTETHWFYKTNSQLCISSLKLLSKKVKLRLILTTKNMFMSWICWHDLSQLYAKMGHLSREDTFILKWLSALSGMTCLGKVPP